MFSLCLSLSLNPKHIYPLALLSGGGGKKQRAPQRSLQRLSHPVPSVWPENVFHKPHDLHCVCSTAGAALFVLMLQDVQFLLSSL